MLRHMNAVPPSRHLAAGRPGTATPHNQRATGNGHDSPPVDQLRALDLLSAQSDLLALASETPDGQSVMSRLAGIVENTFAGSTCVIRAATWPGDDHASTGAAELPPALVACLDRAIGPKSNLAGESVDPQKATIFADLGPVAINPALGELTTKFGYRAMWAYPILRTGGESLGSLLILFSTPREPSAEDSWLTGLLIQLARFAIQNGRKIAALQSADQRFASLAASIPGVVYQRVVRPDGQIRYTYISDGARDLFGVAPEEILADPNALFDCHGPEYRETFRDRLLKASRDLTLWDVEATIISRSGQRKFTHAIAKPHREADGTVVWDGVILDATRIKEAELAAAAAASRTREAIIESLSKGFVLLDASDKLEVCNSHYRALYPEVNALTSEQPTYEELIRTEHRAELAADPGAAESLNRRLAHHSQPQQTVERQLPSGRWVLINEHRVAGGGSVILHTDVTPLKEREAALARSNRELQDFASVASHDLQEPLRKIEAFSDQLRRRSGESLDDNGRFYLERIEKASRRMRALIDDLLSYSRVSTKAQPFARCDLNKIIEGVLSDLRIRIVETQGKIEIGALPTIEADPIQMRQLFQNLISNALKFHRKDVTPVVRVTHAAGEGKAGHCEIHVIDNGIGFDPKYTDRIFNIFQRLHSRSEYEGTGIGLATCRKIVERHKGGITAHSVPGEGSDFAVVLPVQQPRQDFKP